ncbi:MAG: DNA polymerase III subunit chi [Alphaproteobacteria bacterium]|nr:DNA polymerase III subunit chi [Alphaproteobacteria bacterium]
MTEVAFHFNVPQLLPYACRLLRKATQTQARVTVVAPEAELCSLDAQLWTFEADTFLAHCLWDAPAHVLAASPVVLACAESLAVSPHREVLVHWGNAQPPAGFESYNRLIELVSHDEEDRARARGRWKHYADRGYPMSRYDVSKVRV